MKNQTKHIGITAIIACLLAIGVFSLIGCKTYKPADYMRWGDRELAEGKYDDAIESYNWILEEFPKSPEAEVAKEKIAEAQRRKGGSESGSVSAVAQQSPQQKAQQDAQDAQDALQDNPESDFKIEWDDNVKGGAKITQYTGTRRVVRIPASIQNTSVTGIGYSAFEGNEKITNVIIPNGVKSISGFSDCTNLTSITIPNGVTSKRKIGHFI